jgi:hypothetical protein
LLGRFCHPLFATSLAEEQTTDQPYGKSHQRAHSQLLKDIVEQGTAGPLAADLGHGDEKHEKGD